MKRINLPANPSPHQNLLCPPVAIQDPPFSTYSPLRLPSNCTTSINEGLSYFHASIPECIIGRLTVRRQVHTDLSSAHVAMSTRQYMCTYPGCPLEFDAPEEWWLHELNSHRPLKHWLCMKCVLQREPTHWHHHTEADFKSHLSQHRDFSFEDAVEQGYIGDNGRKSFWCGFCECVHRSTKSGDDGLDEQFSHIQDHCRGGEEMTQWLCYVTRRRKTGKKTELNLPRSVYLRCYLSSSPLYGLLH